MKWGRKNSPSSSSKATAGGGGIASWISKIKQISGNSPPPAKTKQKIKVNSSVSNFAGGEEDDDDRLQIRVSNHKIGGSNTTTTTHQSFTDMVSDVRKTKEIVLETPRRRIQKGRKVIIEKSRSADRRNLDDVYSDSIELNLDPIKTMNNFTESRKSHYISSSKLLRERSIQGNRIEIDDLDRKIVIKTEKQRKSIDQKRSKVRIYSPRTPSKVEIIKIRAIEEMKKSKLKKKKMEMEGKRRRGLESCAMVKCSYDPQNDFRESMVEMILEKKISRSDELEELLACYLTLNSDEYHDLIIKVFKQVWFDLNQFSFSPELENQDHSYSDYY